MARRKSERLDDEQLRRLVEARDDGLTFVLIGERFGITPHYASSLYRKHKHKYELGEEEKT